MEVVPNGLGHIMDGIFKTFKLLDNQLMNIILRSVISGF